MKWLIYQYRCAKIRWQIALGPDDDDLTYLATRQRIPPHRRPPR